MKRRHPTKPSQPLGSIVFPKRGLPRKVIESLPGAAPDLEAAIVRKFLGALARFRGIASSPPSRGAPWPDFELSLASTHVGIELTELVHTIHATFRATQDRYLKEILGHLSESLPLLAGLQITINDSYQQPPFPSSQSTAGKQLASFIAARIRGACESLQAVPRGRFFNYIWDDSPPPYRLGIFGHRSAPPVAAIPPRLQFFPSFPEDINEGGTRLRDTIARKTMTPYTSYSKGPLWLLIYELASITVASEDSEALTLSRQLLAEGTQFAEVWYFFPYPEEDAGHMIRIWPAQVLQVA